MIGKCQMQCIDSMHEGRLQFIALPFRARAVITLSSRLNPRIKQSIKHLLKMDRRKASLQKQNVGRSQIKGADSQTRLIKTGDLVRIRPIDEIRGSLNSQNRLKGCKFMPEMEQYCGTIQKVFKPVERYVNECDYTVRKSVGLVLLENLFCHGIAESGPCDRSCFYFWRVEWLEPLPAPEGS